MIKIMGALIIASTIGVVMSIMSFFLDIVRETFFPQSQSVLLSFNKIISMYNGPIFLISALLVIIVTMFMLSDCRRRKLQSEYLEDIWLRVLKTLPVVGVFAYYLLIFEKSVASRLNELIKSKLILKTIYIFSYWGSLSYFALIILLASSLEQEKLSIVLMGLAILFVLVSAAATFMFYLFAIVDAVRRPQDDWEKEDLLTYINPWSWIFGLRKYYFKYLLPSAK